MRRMAALPKEVEQHLEEIRKLCARSHVTRLMLLDETAPPFGGPVPDFVVEFEPHPDPLVRGRRYGDLWTGLVEMIGDVNLVVISSIKDPSRLREIQLAHHDIYAAA